MFCFTAEVEIKVVPAKKKGKSAKEDLLEVLEQAKKFLEKPKKLKKKLGILIFSDPLMGKR